VTLELEPGQAQTVAMLVNNSENALTLSLRNNDDLERISLPMTGLVDIIGAEAMAKAKPQQQGGKK
jgi:hypothetical protein